MEGSGQVEGFGGRRFSGTLTSSPPGGHPMQTEVVVGFWVPGAPVQEGKVLHSQVGGQHSERQTGQGEGAGWTAPGAARVAADGGQPRAAAIDPLVTAAAKERTTAHASPADSARVARSRVKFDASSDEQASEKQEGWVEKGGQRRCEGRFPPAGR